MKRLFQSKAPIFLLICSVPFIHACSSTFSSPSLSNKEILNFPHPSAESFKKDGHFYTVDYVASLANVGNDRRKRLSCYSQAPDEVLKYNAVSVSFLFFNWSYRSKIVNGLHSLHGGNHAEVNRRRSILQRLIRTSFENKEIPDWQTGFLIHALGDSYAHVHGDFDNSVAYGELVGHGFSWTHDPDTIYEGDNYKKYNAYVIALFEALAGKLDNDDISSGRATLTTFTQNVKFAAESELHEKNLTRILMTAHEKITESGECRQFYSSLNSEDILKFLTKLKVELKT